MSTVKVRYLGAKQHRVIELPIGLSAASEKTGEVMMNPVGEFPAAEAQKLISLPGASKIFVLEDEYQAALHPQSEVAAALKKEQSRERGRKLAAWRAEQKAAAGKGTKHPVVEPE